jgi:hypothetical protein
MCRVLSNVNLRNGPANTAPIINNDKVLIAGSRVTKLADSTDGLWIQVLDPSDNIEGWVFQDFLEGRCR